MSRRLIRVHAVPVILLLAVTPATAGEISFLEDFSLPPDRSVALKTLIPGTQDYFYFHCLHLQNQRKYDEVDAVMERWLQTAKTQTMLYREIENRQVLLRYARRPMQTIEYLRNRLKPSLNHQRKNPAAKAQLPSTLDARWIATGQSKTAKTSRTAELDGCCRP